MSRLNRLLSTFNSEPSPYMEDRKKSEKDTSVIDEANINFDNLVRFIPTGSKVNTELNDKSLKLQIITQVSAPPLTTKEIEGIERRLYSNMDKFIKDVESAIKLKNVTEPPYIFMTGVKNGIHFLYETTLYVGSKVEGKKLASLDDALEFYKKFKLS